MRHFFAGPQNGHSTSPGGSLAAAVFFAFGFRPGRPQGICSISKLKIFFSFTHSLLRSARLIYSSNSFLTSPRVISFALRTDKPHNHVENMLFSFPRRKIAFRSRIAQATRLENSLSSLMTAFSNNRPSVCSKNSVCSPNSSAISLSDRGGPWEIRNNKFRFRRLSRIGSTIGHPAFDKAGC